MLILEEFKDSPEKIQARKDQADPWVAYFIVRKSLQMSIGKTSAQVGHGVQKIDLAYMKLKEKTSARGWMDEVEENLISSYEQWMHDSFTKIVKGANDNDWEKIKEQLSCLLVQDYGLTEISPGSETVIALWPMRKSETPKIISRLQLL